MKVATATIPAHKPNEDCFLVDEKLGIFGVFDGVGGARGGAAAAKIAAKVIAETFKEHNRKHKKQEASEILREALMEAAHQIAINGQIYGRFNQATAVTVVKISDNKIIIANVGDCRCYGLTQERELKRLTVDHGILEELIKSRQISLDTALKIDQAKDKKELTAKELAIFNQRHVITEALAAEFEKDVHIDFNEVDAKKFKMLILTTDGVHDNLTDEEIFKIVVKYEEPKEMVKKVANAALKVSCNNTLRSKSDDMTAVIVEL